MVQTQLQAVWQQYRDQFFPIDPWTEQMLHELEAYSFRAGKAWRPLLVAAGAAAARQATLEESLALPAVQRLSIVIELLHKRLLIADDIADRDEQRHGEPAFHIMLEQRLATDPRYSTLPAAERAHVARSYSEVAGVWLQSLAHWLLTDTDIFPSHQQQPLAVILQREVYDYTIDGWYTLFDQNRDALDSTPESEQRLLTGLEHVTGHYSITAPLQLGMRLGSDERYAQLAPLAQELGQAAGTLFQLADDVLGLFGDPAVTRKPVGGDLREGKKTLLVQYAFARANAADKKRLAQVVGAAECSSADVTWVQELVRSSGAYDEVLTVMDRYEQQAYRVLDAWDHEPSQTALRALFAKLGHRDH